MSFENSSALPEATSPDPITPFAEGIVGHMNADHADANSLLLRHFLGRPDVVSAQMTGVDRLGCDFAAITATGTEALRLTFPSPAVDRAAVRNAIVAMVRQAEAERTTSTPGTPGVDGPSH